MARREAVDEARLVAAVLSAFEEAGPDYEPVLDEACRLGTELTGDPWLIRLIDDDGRLQLSGSAAPDPMVLADLRASIGNLQPDYATSFSASLLRDGRSVLVTGTGGSTLRPVVSALLDRLGIVGGVLAPLRVRGRVIGTLWWLCQNHAEGHDADDQLFASSVADRCALAIDNARLLRSLRSELEERTRADLRHSALLAHVSDAIVVVNGEALLTHVTDGVTRVLGWDPDEVLGHNVFEYVHPDDHAHAMDRFLEVLGADELPATTIRIRHRDLGWRHVEVSGDNLLDDPAVLGVVITAHDVTDRWWADQLLGAENEILDLVARGAELGPTLDAICRMIDQWVGGVATLWLLDEDRNELVSVAGPGIVAASRAQMGVSSLGRVGATWVKQLPDHVLVSDPATDPYWAEWRDEAARFGVTCSWTYPVRNAEGRILGALIVYRGEHREPEHRDQQVTELAARLAGVAVQRDRDARSLAYSATHDSVTGAANRALFVSRLEQSIERQRDGAPPPAILFIDLDRFKQLNDRAGHAAGDTALHVLARRLHALIRPGDVVARFGGDEFSVLLEETTEGVAEQVAHRLLAAIREPIDLGDRTHHLSASIGLAVGRAGIDADTLVRRADLAMYRAKSVGRSRVVRYEAAMRSANDSDDLERDLRAALDTDQISLLYQPLVHLETREWRGLEALARWDHPERGAVDPEVFIAIAEESDLVGALGALVLDRVCAQLAAWREHPVMRRVVVGVNVSGRQLMDPAFVPALAARLAAARVKPTRLLVELTETALMEDFDAAQTAVVALRELGVSLVIDDFGTGQSTLARLRQFPAYGVKLDRSFIVDLAEDQRSEDIVAAVAQLAHAVGMALCAEGVESADQIAVLQRLGVDLAQGFFLSRPVPAADVEGLFVRPPTVLRPEFLRAVE